MSNSESARTEAQLVLKKYWHPGLFPVDPAVIANEMGLTVKEIELDDRISGALIKNKGQDPVIFINATDGVKRKCFTCAHEVGHYVLRNHSEEFTEDYWSVDLRHEVDSSNGTDPNEIFANQFAANLLMPEDMVKDIHSSGMPPYAMASYFGVSIDAMQFRLKNLGLSQLVAAA